MIKKNVSAENNIYSLFAAKKAHMLRAKSGRGRRNQPSYLNFGL